MRSTYLHDYITQSNLTYQGVMHNIHMYMYVYAYMYTVPITTSVTSHSLPILGAGLGATERGSSVASLCSLSNSVPHCLQVPVEYQRLLSSLHRLHTSLPWQGWVTVGRRKGRGRSTANAVLTTAVEHNPRPHTADVFGRVK